MAAGLETAVDTRGQSKLVGNIVEKILLARQLAENERKFAAKKAEEAGTSLEEAGIERGHFFKKALIGEFGGNYFEKKKKNLKNIVKKYRIAKRLTKDPKKAFRFVKPLLQKKVTSAQTKMFRAQFDYTYSDNINRPDPQTPIVGGTTKKIQKATGGKKRISNEELLKTLSTIAESLNKTAETIGRNTSGMSTGVISAVKSQHELVEQLKLRNTSIEDKLDDIANAISNQTQIQKKIVVKAKTARKEQNLETATDVAETEVADDTETAVDETLMAQLAQNITPTTNIVNNQTLQQAPSRPAGGYPSFANISKPGMDIPGFEKGGVVSGPNSGYLAKVPKGSTIVPLDNNYTRGKPSAIDGRVRQKPQTTSSRVGGRFGFGITNMTGIAGGGTTEASKMAQPLIDAMSLPMMVAGGSILSTVTKLMSSMGSEGESIAPEIERMTRPIADVFGLPPSVVKRIKGGTKVSAKVEKEEEDEPKKNILSKLIDGFGALMEKLKEGINNTQNPSGTNPSGSANLIPGDAPPEIKALMESISGGEGSPNSVNTVGEVAGLTEMTIDQAIAKGLELKAQGKSSGALGAYQMMPQYLRERAIKAGLDPAKDKFSMENQTQIMRTFMVGLYGQTEETLVRHLREGKLESHIFPKLSRDSGWPSLPGGSQPNVHTPQAKSRYEKALKKYQQVASKPKTPTSTSTLTTQNKPGQQLGQQITSNYGLEVGQERTFTVPGYGEVKAHKTKTGFDFYKDNVKLDMSPSNPQAKIIVDYFKSIQGGNADLNGLQSDLEFERSLIKAKQSASINAPKNSLAVAQQISQPLDSNSGGNIVAMMLPQGQNQKQTATTAMPSSAETSTTGKSFNPLDNSGLYNTNVLA